jgi:rod shape-determining protein MreC
MPLLPPDRRAEAVAIACAAASLVLLALPDSRQDSLARSVNHVVTLPVSRVREVFGGYLRLRTENANLRRQLQEARIELSDSDIVRAQNRELRDLLGFADHLPVRLTAARVISRDFATAPSVMIVDAGGADNVTENLPIVTDEGLVGKVVSVGPGTSEVMLYTHPDFSASALLLGGDHLEYGIVRPSAAGRLQLLLPLRARSEPGDRIVTSGYGGVFPRGIPIGQVTASQEDQRLGLQQIDLVEPVVELGSLTAVFVLMRGSSPDDSAGDDLRLFWPGYAHPPMVGERLGGRASVVGGDTVTPAQVDSDSL